MSHVYPRETTLFRLCAFLSGLFWLVLVVGTFGVGLVYVLGGFIAYLFVHSGFISYVRGNCVRVGPDQLPEIQERVDACCRALEMADKPDVYVLNSQGVINALATRFLWRNYVVLFSDVIDALEARPGALNFYIGHELGHIARGHLGWAAFLAPARVLPILGAAYSRAREYTCDLHGLACCDDPLDAAYGLAVLAAGERCWDRVNLTGFAQQSAMTGGFWMSFHEITGDYPWLTKRMTRLLSASGGGPVRFPRRRALAWLLALFVPNTGAGNANSLAAMMTAVAVVGILAAIAIPNFLRFQLRAKGVGAARARAEVQSLASAYILEHRALPSSLTELGLPADYGNDSVQAVRVTDRGFELVLAPSLQEGFGESFELVPRIENGQLVWSCGPGLDDSVRPIVCGDGRAPAAPASAPAEAAPSPAPPAAAAPRPAPRDGSRLSGSWAPLSDDGTQPQLSFGPAGSVVVTLPDGSKILGLYTTDGNAVEVRYTSDSGEQVARFERVYDGNGTLLRPLEGGPFYAPH